MSDTVIFVMEVLGTVAFAVSGALVAITGMVMDVILQLEMVKTSLMAKGAVPLLYAAKLTFCAAWEEGSSKQSSMVSQSSSG